MHVNVDSRVIRSIVVETRNPFCRHRSANNTFSVRCGTGRDVGGLRIQIRQVHVARKRRRPNQHPSGWKAHLYRLLYAGLAVGDHRAEQSGRLSHNT